jgi:hypothetical protein
MLQAPDLKQLPKAQAFSLTGGCVDGAQDGSMPSG